MSSYARAVGNKGSSPSSAKKSSPSSAKRTGLDQTKSAAELTGQQANGRHGEQPGTNESRRKKTPSPSHRPETASSKDETVYVLTLRTDKAHHDRMTALRQRYFPPRINKLDAHLTLFHALPDGRLDSHILPTIRAVAAQTAPFEIHASKPIRLKHGIAVSVSGEQGGKQAQDVHRALLSEWAGQRFLSQQDAGGFRAHYTIMNKVDDENQVAEAFDEVTAGWKGDWGVVDGLSMWQYVKGWWRWQEDFEFEGRR